MWSKKDLCGSSSGSLCESDRMRDTESKIVGREKQQRAKSDQIQISRDTGERKEEIKRHQETGRWFKRYSRQKNQNKRGSSKLGRDAAESKDEGPKRAVTSDRD